MTGRNMFIYHVYFRVYIIIVKRLVALYLEKSGKHNTERFAKFTVFI
jgi:hypothetical protein